MHGSVHNDSILNEAGITQTNHSGGINGGISNGNQLVYRIAVKPTSSTPQIQTTYNQQTGQTEPFMVKGRHDLCIALRVPVVVEAITAIALADFILLEQARK
jgi:chorismate synthase